MDNTTNYKLRKPSQFVSVNIEDLNYNADIIDGAIKAAKDAADNIDLSKKYEKPSTGIPKTDLASAVQTSLGKADTALQSATKSTVGLGNVDNTSDANKPVSTAQATAINAKYSKPSTGVPKTDLSQSVQASLDKADNAATQAVLGELFVEAGQITSSITNLKNDFIQHLNEDEDWSNTDYIPLKQKVTQHLDDYVKHSANGGTTAGTANAYTCNSSPNPAALVDKMGLVITIHVDSGSNPTLKWGSLVAKPIKKPNGSAANLKKDGLYSLRYNAVNDSFILQGEGGEFGNVTPSDVRAGKTFGTEDGVKIGTLTIGKTQLLLNASTFVKGLIVNNGSVGFGTNIIYLGQTSYGSGTATTTVESVDSYDVTDKTFAIFYLTPTQWKGSGSDYFRVAVGPTSTTLTPTTIGSTAVVDISALTGVHKVWAQVVRAEIGEPRYTDMQINGILLV